MQFRNFLRSDDQSQNSGRRRRYRIPPQIEDELDKYLSKPEVPENFYNGDPMAEGWFRKVSCIMFFSSRPSIDTLIYGCH
jgi:hypothetical protein